MTVKKINKAALAFQGMIETVFTAIALETLFD